MSRLQRFQKFLDSKPRALPQAVTFRAFGAEEPKFFRVYTALWFVKLTSQS
jgi:hypothetical protein